MPSTHHTPYLSPSRLSLYRQCPALYRRRYVDGVYDPPTIDMEYGQAIHHALESSFLGQDAELQFLSELKTRLAPLIAAGADPASWLVPQGLRLIQDVQKLGYRGQPERRFIFAYAGFRIPFRGIIDLWDKPTGLVVDWKTTRRQWSEKTAEQYAFQRAMYCQAMLSEFHKPVRFQFVALGAYPGGFVQVVDCTPTEDDINNALAEIYPLYLGIEAEDWACRCRDHVHDTATPEAAA